MENHADHGLDSSPSTYTQPSISKNSDGEQSSNFRYVQPWISTKPSILRPGGEGELQYGVCTQAHLIPNG